MTALPELDWVGHMRQYIGQREIKGPKHNQIIVDHIAAGFEATKQKPYIFKDGKIEDETAYCGSFLGGVFAKVGLGEKVPKLFFRALEWNNAGAKLDKPCYGCVVVFKRKGGGHVGLLVGKTKTGLLKILGANQSDEINIQDFPTDEVVGYRWIGRTNTPASGRFDIPVLAAGRIRTSLT